MKTYETTDEKARQIETSFTYHDPVEGQPDKYVKIRSDAKELALLICEYCPPSREQSLALTKLEEVVMWANAAIARNEVIGTKANTPKE